MLRKFLDVNIFQCPLLVVAEDASILSLVAISCCYFNVVGFIFVVVETDVHSCNAHSYYRLPKVIPGFTVALYEPFKFCSLMLIVMFIRNTCFTVLIIIYTLIRIAIKRKKIRYYCCYIHPKIFFTFKCCYQCGDFFMSGDAVDTVKFYFYGFNVPIKLYFDVFIFK